MMKSDNSETSLANAGKSDTLEFIKTTGEGALNRQLLDMGVFSGVCARVVKFAPLMDPMEIITKGVHMSLRVAEAARIMVKPTSVALMKEEDR
jgi:Fe2+ transport system protein FeoA